MLHTGIFMETIPEGELYEACGGCGYWKKTNLVECSCLCTGPAKDNTFAGSKLRGKLKQAQLKVESSYRRIWLGEAPIPPPFNVTSLF